MLLPSLRAPEGTSLLKLMVQSLKIAAILVLAAVIVVTTQRTLARYLEESNANVGQPVTFVVEPDESVDSIAARLHEEGLIRSPTYFKLRVRLSNADTRIQAGRFVLYTGMSVNQIIQTLTTSEPIEVVQVRFQEGWRLEQYAEQLVAVGLISSPEEFINAAQGESWRAAYDFLRDLPPGASLEGYLFPDTYEFRVDTTPEEIIRTMLDNFDRRVPPELRARAAERGLNLHQVLTIASIVEREAVIPEERPIIASVFYNRLRQNMPLQADPTIQYFVGQPGNWWPEITQEDIQRQHVYNTYQHTGYPPGPICNPGLASIEAAINPADTNYLYFVTRGDGSGGHVFAVTYEEHLRNINEQHGG